MNRRRLFRTHVGRWLAVLSVLGVVLALMPSTVSARAARTPFWGDSNCGPSKTVDLWISGGKVLHLRGGNQVCELALSDARVSGTETITLNADLRFVEGGGLAGPVWGTSILVSGDGYWDVVWTGTIEADGSMTVRAVLEGHGPYEGLRGEYTAYRPAGQMSYLQVTGTILEMGADTP
jgi:hypothetical protein